MNHSLCMSKLIYPTCSTFKGCLTICHIQILEKAFVIDSAVACRHSSFFNLLNMLGDFPKSKLSHLLWFFSGSLPYFVYHIYRSADGFFYPQSNKRRRERERERENWSQEEPVGPESCFLKMLTVIAIERGRKSEGDRGRRGRERGRSDQTRPDKTIRKENNAKSLHNYLLCV